MPPSARRTRGPALVRPVLVPALLDDVMPAALSDAVAWFEQVRDRISSQAPDVPHAGEWQAVWLAKGTFTYRAWCTLVPSSPVPGPPAPAASAAAESPARRGRARQAARRFVPAAAYAAAFDVTLTWQDRHQTRVVVRCQAPAALSQAHAVVAALRAQWPSALAATAATTTGDDASTTGAHLTAGGHPATGAQLVATAHPALHDPIVQGAITTKRARGVPLQLLAQEYGLNRNWVQEIVRRERMAQRRAERG